MRVLWIDDESAFLRIQARILRAYHDVRTVMTAGEAFAVLAVEKFDVILCDVNLPGMSGPVFFEKLSFAERAQIIFVTGGSSGENVRFLAEHRTLMKPFSREELLAAISQIGVAAPARAAHG
jgi:DNA-binding response OmpR family regulator